jgi:bacteriorhodopsin
MKLELSDRSWACIAGLGLLGLASFAVFGFQHGFEGQIAWYFTLLPGSIVAVLISDLFNKSATRGESVLFWALFICFNFLWYFGISYAVIKAYRFLSKSAS